MNTLHALSLSLALVVASPGIAQAQPAASVDPTFEDPAAKDPTDDAQPPSTTRTSAPNTDDCPFALRPEEPVTTSERLAPGQASPVPLPPVESAEGCGVSAPPGFRVDEKVYASAWMVTDLDTGEIVAMKDPNGRYRPASIIKALLALVAIEELDLSKQVAVSDESAGIDGSAVGIGPGGKYTNEQLLEGLLLASGNDAAHALAQELGGDAVALRKVNDLAHKLGTTSTYAASYSGLDAPGMSTSARDLSVIYKAAFANPDFARIVGTDHVPFPGYGDLPGYEVWNDNKLFLNDPNGIGGKTGYTDDAHHTFVGALDRDGRRLQAVLLNTTIDHGTPAWQQAQMLLDEAYRVPAGQGVGSIERAAQPAPSPTDAPETPTATPAAAPDSSSSPAHSPWLGWLVVGAVGLSALVLGAFSLLRRPRGRRGRHAAR